jgi:hypothetical protein
VYFAGNGFRGLRLRRFPVGRLGLGETTLDDLIEFLATEPTEPAEVTIDFFQGRTEPFLGGLKKNIDPLVMIYPGTE